MIDDVIVLGKIGMRDDMDVDAYTSMRADMLAIVEAMPGFHSVKRYVAEDGEAINIYHFASEEALDQWRRHPEHMKTKAIGRREFYETVHLKICKVIREVNFTRKP